MKKIIINCNLEYILPENIKTEEDIINFAHDLELPHEYVTDSFELKGVYNEETNEMEIYF